MANRSNTNYKIVTGYSPSMKKFASAFDYAFAVLSLQSDFSAPVGYNPEASHKVKKAC